MRKPYLQEFSETVVYPMSNEGKEAGQTNSTEPSVPKRRAETAVASVPSPLRMRASVNPLRTILKSWENHLAADVSTFSVIFVRASQVLLSRCSRLSGPTVWKFILFPSSPQMR